MTKRTNQPAIDGMGLWKWPALGLLLFSFGMLVPYSRNAGRVEADTKDQVIAGQALGCDVRLHFRLARRSASARGMVDRRCAARIAGMTLRLIDAHGEVFAERPLRGNPNALSARINCGAGECAPARIELIAASAVGEEERLSWSASFP